MSFSKSPNNIINKKKLFKSLKTIIYIFEKGFT